MAKTETRKLKLGIEPPAVTTAVAPGGVAIDIASPLETVELQPAQEPAVSGEGLAAAVAELLDQPILKLPEPTPVEFVEQLEDAGASRPTLGVGMTIAEPVYIISAPGGPRRRANLAFGPEPRELRWEELGPDPEAALEALRGDPLLKIDGRYEERPAEPDGQGD